MSILSGRTRDVRHGSHCARGRTRDVRHGSHGARSVRSHGSHCRKYFKFTLCVMGT